MSDIGGIFGPADLALLMLLAGSPGLAIGGVAGVLMKPRGRLAGALIGGAIGFVICLGGVLFWLLHVK